MTSTLQLSTHFRRHEFACPCGCGFNTIDAELLYVLESIRDHFQTPVIINSGARCMRHNVSVGGAALSKHTLGQAADIRVGGAEPDKVFAWLDKTFPDCYGIGRYDTWTHIDVRPNRSRWDKREVRHEL